MAGSPDNPVAAAERMQAGDLAELMGIFNEVTGRLERTHDKLRSEVARLSAELRQANEALERSRRLAALGEMAAGIAHEIRNPLASMRLYAKMLEDDLVHQPEQRQIAVKIDLAVRRLDEVVTDVLSFAREVRTRPEPADASALLTAALESCGVDPASVDRPDLDRPPVEIECDTALVLQALVNLIRNAVEAAADEPRGRVTVDALAAVLPIDGAAAKQAVRLIVADTGPGIPPEVIDRMFNPFFTTRSTGTGLGLAIVNRIAEAHGGRVVVTNNADNSPGALGATVELQLPAEAETSPAIVVSRPIQPGEVRGSSSAASHIAVA